VDPVPGCNYISDDTLDPPIPVIFGVPYTLQISGSMDCIEGEPEPCGDIETYLSNLTVTDAAGNPIAIESVHDGLIVLAPEPTSISLLGIVISGVGFAIKHKFSGVRNPVTIEKLGLKSD
jgi:hypothetical protein